MADFDLPELDESFGREAFSNLFRLYVAPELRLRIERGELPNPFPDAQLIGIQILFPADVGRPTVRLNHEVRATCRFQSKPGMDHKPGDGVRNDAIETISEIWLKDEDRDCGHATFLRRPDGGWWGYFSFIRHTGTARNLLEVADQDLVAAERIINEGTWVPFVDNCFSAAELAAKSLLFYHDSPGVVAGSKKHSLVRSRFNFHRHRGNVDASQCDALNRLWDLRQAGRYAERDISIDAEDAKSLLRRP
jgi:uncharacterized protein (UPF0332 family)